MIAEAEISPGRAAYSDRSCPPQLTVERLRPHFADLGITRLAKQTGLDTLGIPCFAAIRPNAKSLAVSQGKGLDDAAAAASAVMEAAELAIAERPLPSIWNGPAQRLVEMGARWFDPSRLLPMGASFELTKSISWVLGRGLLSDLPYLVPRDVVRLDGLAPDLPSICQHTNGLASGNTEAEAIFHATCELLERDAATLWSVRSTAYQAGRVLNPAAFRDAEIDRLCELIATASLDLSLFDMTSDLGVPTIRAVIGPGQSWRYFDVAEGSGTHPVAVRAAIRAITEAAQSRVTAIAGARDDIDLSGYDARAERNGGHDKKPTDLPPGLDLGSELAASLLFLSQAFKAADVAEPVVVNLGGEAFGIAVVRVLSTELEDREANANWRPGGRSVTALLEDLA